MMADSRVLEHPTLKVPYEVLNRRFRNTQKAIDKEISVVNAANNALKSSMQDCAEGGEVDDLINNVVEKLKILKRKAKTNIEEEEEAARVCKRRVCHLQEYEVLDSSSQALWKTKRLDRMLVEHCLRLGYYETAVGLAKHSDIKDLTNLDIFIQSEKIEEALINHDTALCLAWCYENKTKLKKNQSTLEMALRQQDFIELIKSNSRMEAVKYARKYFSISDNMRTVQQMMALLAFNARTDIHPYCEYFSEDRWSKLVEDFRKENFNLHQVSTNSVFLVALQTGLSALKTPHCYGETSRNSNCPVCIKNLNKIASTLPSSHCSQSRLICPVEGGLLNENNPPLALPNGHVYGTLALQEMASQNNGTVRCPRTNDLFQIEEASKVYIM